MLKSATNDPYCAFTNAAGAIQGNWPQPESTRRMAERLVRVKAGADPRKNIFISDRRAAMYAAKVNYITNLSQKLPIQYQLGVELLNSGRTEESLAEFKQIEEAGLAAGANPESQMWSAIRMQKAIAMMRLGEQQNCLMHHSPDSCLFPIQPAGYHHLQAGSRGAIGLLRDELNQAPGNLSARWLLNIAYMTLGEYPAKVPSAWLIPPSAFKSDYEMPRFPDVAAEAGLDTENIAGGCILDDFDNDGLIDVVVSCWALDGQLRYFHNDGNGHFTERTGEARLLGIVGGLNIQQTDYNNDGWLDIWVLRGAWMGKEGRMPRSLLRNNGDGTFTDVTEEAGLLTSHPTQTSAWFDYDGDGWLDLFIGNESLDPADPDPCQLYHNNHDGTFSECAAASGLSVSRFVKGVACADYDNDGRPDLYLSCRDGQGILFHNDGPADPGDRSSTARWKFSDTTHAAGIGPPTHSFPTWFFDYDNDGYEDLFVCGYLIKNVGDVAADYLGLPHTGELPKLYHNNGNGTFSDVTESAHLNRLCQTMGSNFGDLDNDGWLDFYLGTGDPDFTTLIPNRMFRNAAGKYFQEVTSVGGFGHLQKGHAVAFADLDNDGDQDVYIVMGGAYPGDVYRNCLFLNPGNTNRWLKLKLEGARSNRAAIGTRLKVTVATPSGLRDVYKTVNSGGSFGSSPLRQEIGLGDATAIAAVEVFWPASGLHQKLAGLSLDHAYKIREGDGAAAPLELKRFSIAPPAKEAILHVMKDGGL